MQAYPPARESTLVAALLCAVLLPAMPTHADDPLVIAHRGASAYLPEHTLAAKALAFAMGADYLEQDVVLSRDQQPVVLHDITLDATTNVAERFPGRARDDGLHYAADFSLEELRTLRVNERVDIRSGEARYPGRFPIDANPFRLHTLGEELELVRGLNHRFGRRVGVYVEIKNPAWHAAEGLDATLAILDTLERHGYDGPEDRAFIQSFDPAALRRLRDEFGSAIPRVQLIGENRWWPDSAIDYDAMRTPAGLADIATYAAGIGPWIGQLVTGLDTGLPVTSPLAADARAAGLFVHPYTVRADRLPEGVHDLDDLLDLLVARIGVDGLFTDFPDAVRDYLDRRGNPGAATRSE